MEQDAEMNRILIASTERMVKFQADAQVQSAELLQKCAQSLSFLSSRRSPGNSTSNREQEGSEITDEDDEVQNGVLLA